MATSLLRKLVRNESRFRSLTVSYFTTTTNSAAASTQPPPFSVQSHATTKTQHPILVDPSLSHAIYPSFSFQHFLNPVLPFAPDTPLASDNEVEDEGSDTLWASSVKKKRKHKMNKHKLKKFKKALRRKTKK